jgi:hypothetical protein
MFLRKLIAVSAHLSAAVAAVAVIALMPTGVAVLIAQRESSGYVDLLPADDDWDTFSADVTIRRHLLTAEGKTSAEAPTVRYRWTRAQRAGGWKSTIEITGLANPMIRSPKGPVLLERPASVVRIEDDEDGTPLRVFDRRGRPVRLPSIEDRRVLGEPVEGSLRVPAVPELAHVDAKRPAHRGRDWVDAFIAVPGRKALRREALNRRFGRAIGRVRDLDRFVTGDGKQTMEVLTDRMSAVPVEINVARDGRLVAQSTLTYGLAADGTLRRRAVHTEQRVSASSAERAVAHIELSNLRLERRGGAR